MVRVSTAKPAWLMAFTTWVSWARGSAIMCTPTSIRLATIPTGLSTSTPSSSRHCRTTQCSGSNWAESEMLRAASTHF